MHEIELKAHVTDYLQTERIIGTFADYNGSAQKNDTYWFNNQLPLAVQTVRVRLQENTFANGKTNSQTIVTYKSKQIRSQIEVNKETEFTVSSKADFEGFLQDAGYSVQREKSKKTQSWVFENVHIELCTIPPLGHFIEIEILSQNDDEKTILECKKQLLTILKKCGAEEKDIETKYYSEMLTFPNA